MRHIGGIYEPDRKRSFEETNAGTVCLAAVAIWACLIWLFFYVALG